jgi:hypothetical protein
LVKMYAGEKFDRTLLSGIVWVMEGLSAGETPKVADSRSGFYGAIVTELVAKFSPRGDEYRTWYNGQFGAKDVEIGLRK